jgi:hypothetical protein
MKALVKILAGGIGLAALASAAPASAQYYPPNPYGYGNNNVVGQVIGQILNPYGYGRYPYGNYGYNQYANQGAAVDQCARAVEARLGGYNGNGYYGYGNVPYGGRYGYNTRNGYNGYAGGRVQGITRVDRKSYGLKVFGVASSGYQGYQGYGQRGYGSYGYNAGADLSFNCEVRYDGRIRDIDINRRSAYWRGY